MGRTRASLLLGIALVAHAGVASATSLSMRWSGSTGTGSVGNSSINVSNSSVETLTLELILTATGAGVSGYFLSLRFDTDGDNELNVLALESLSWSNAMGTRTLTPFHPGVLTSQESQDGGPEGQLFTFGAYTVGSGIKNASMVFGRVHFETNPSNVSYIGPPDVFLGLFNVGFDGIVDDGANVITPTGNLSASVFASVPEPELLALLALSTGALLVAGRRRR